MKYNNTIKKFTLIVSCMLVLFVLMLRNLNAQEDAIEPKCQVWNYPEYEWGENYIGQWMGISTFYLNTLKYERSWEGTNLGEFIDGYTTTLKIGDTYSFEVGFCEPGPWCGDWMDFILWIDWNRDGSFDFETEMVYWAGYEDWQGFKDELKVPDDAVEGKTYLRIIADYQWSAYFDPYDACMGIYAGSSFDFIINIEKKKPDASIVAISHPELPLKVGSHPIGATIRNLGELDFSSVTVRWSVNGVQQTPYYWNGYLTPGQSTSISLGDYDFQYPVNGPWNPFVVRVWTEAPDGVQPDAVPSNDLYQKNLTFILDDAGITEFTSPAESVAPGSYPITVKLQNFGPRILSSANIHWSVDGINMNTYEWTGSLITGQTQDVVIGNYNIQYKKPVANYSFRAWTSMPNGNEDLINENNLAVTQTTPTISPFEFVIGGPQSHFTTLKAFTDYTNTYGVRGSGVVDVVINPGTYYGPFELQYFPHEVNSLIFRTASGENDVRLQHTSGQSSNYIMHIAGFTNLEFYNINFIAQGKAALVRFDNSNNIKFEDNVFRGISNSPQLPEYNLLSFYNVANVSINNSSFIDGSTSLEIINGVGNFEFSHNTIANPSYKAISIQGMDVNMLYNKITSNLGGNKIALEFDNCSGLIANQLISGNNFQSLNANNSKGLVLYYNTFLTSSNDDATVSIFNGQNEFYRNSFANQGIAPAISMRMEEDGEYILSYTGAQNNFYSVGENFEYNAVKNNNISNWQQWTDTDNNSFSKEMIYESTSNPLISRFSTDLALGAPLGIDEDLDEKIQEKDFFGKIRRNFVIGAEDLVLKPEITIQPIDVIACENDKDRFLSVAAKLEYGAKTEFQWYFDGQPLPGETKPILELPALQYSHSGVYQVKVLAPYGLDYTMSKPATVYVVTETEIVEQPNSLYIGGTNEYIIKVKAHARFLPPDFVFDYQWFRWSESMQRATPLVNDFHYSGVHSDQLRISNPLPNHYTENGDYYFVEVRGLCDMVVSEPGYLSETPIYGVNILNQLENEKILCSDEDLSLTIQAQGVGLSKTLTYQWRKNGTPINDGGRITGTKTPTLSIANTRQEDSGFYTVLVREEEGGNTALSNSSKVTILPTATQFITEYPEEEVEVGSTHSFTFPNYASQDVVYEWIFVETGETIPNETTYTLVLNNIQNSDAGKYRLIVTNICGELHSIYFNLKVVPEGGNNDNTTSVSFEPKGINNLFEPVPTPTHNIVTITFELINAGNTELFLVDALGNKVANLYNGISDAGVQQMEFDLSRWNLSSGTYFIQLKSNGLIMNKPLMLIR